MVRISSNYNKEFMTDCITISFQDKWVSFNLPASASIEDYCAAMEGAINKLAEET